ncbi:MAG TPA: cytochrome P450 [Pseudonocardiaceae bacterium]|jgi:cytochrome P450|nr:cytochrome P450 [Pseudonocardiaceae bacterium]
MTQAPTAPVHVRRNNFDPAPELAQMRAAAPISKLTMPWGAEVWLATRYREVRQILGDAARFSNGGAGIAGGPLQGTSTSAERNDSGFLLSYDPPDHTRLRKLLTPAFTVARMRRLRPRIETIVADHLAAMADAGSPADLVSAFALPIPSLVICELLGVPYSDRDMFQRLSRERLDISLDIAARTAAGEAARAYMRDLVAAERRSPGDAMLGMLVREHGDEIGDHELSGVADLLLLAGHETTSNMLGLGTLLLLCHPDAVPRLHDPEQIDTVVEEMLRYLSVLHSVIPRTATEDVAFGDLVVRKGDMVLCSLPAANRDPELGADMDTVDFTRRITSHLAFGHGVHHCLGAPLARMEMRIAYPALFERFPGLTLAVPFEDVDFRAMSVVYGLGSLPVSW